jgi:hypothetical protein
MDPQPSNQLGRHSRRMDQGFIGGHRERPRWRVHASDGAPRRPERGPSALPGLAMDLAAPIPLGIPGPGMPAGADRGVCRMAAPVAPPLVGRQPCAARRHVVGEEAVPRPCVRVVAAPEARRPRLPRQEADEGGPIVGSGAVPWALMGASTGRGGGIARRRALLPQRADPAPPPRRMGQPARPGEPSRAGGPGGAAAGSAAAGVPGPHARARRAVDAPWALPRRRTTRGAGRGRGCSTTVPVSRVSSPAPARPREAGQGPCARHRRRSAQPQRGQRSPPVGRWRSSQMRQRRSSRRSPIGTSIIRRRYHTPHGGYT